MIGAEADGEDPGDHLLAAAHGNRHGQRGLRQPRVVVLTRGEPWLTSAPWASCAFSLPVSNTSRTAPDLKSSSSFWYCLVIAALLTDVMSSRYGGKLSAVSIELREER